jgi:hypothetical protein
MLIYCLREFRPLDIVARAELRDRVRIAIKKYENQIPDAFIRHCMEAGVHATAGTGKIKWTVM